MGVMELHESHVYLSEPMGMFRRFGTMGRGCV